jgi:hypothetical protein
MTPPEMNQGIELLSHRIIESLKRRVHNRSAMRREESARLFSDYGLLEVIGKIQEPRTKSQEPRAKNQEPIPPLL